MLKEWLRRHRPSRARRIAPHAEWLEPRLLYAADAAGLLGLDTAIAPASEQRSLDASFEYVAESAQAATPADVRSAYALTPLQFEADAGQLGEGVDFAAAGIGYGVRLGGGQAELLLAGVEQPVRLELVGAEAGTAVGEELLATRSNHLVGDASRWVTDIANYRSVLYRGVYEGIDVRYHGNQDQLEYDFLLAPGADAALLQLRFHGVDEVAIAADGDLLLRVAGTARELRFEAPVSWQDGEGGREPVESRYQLQADGSVRIVVGAYDTSRALVVDPVLSHGSYFGEAGQETATGVAVGADGSVYVTGQTTSTSGSFASRLPSGSETTETFVAKFNADLSALVYATRVGGAGAEQGNAIAVDAAGNAVVTGWTQSADFPVSGSAGAVQQQEAFVYKLNAAGNGLVFSTLYGKVGNTDSGNAVAIDAAGNIYVAGTESGSSDDAFLNKYTPTGGTVFKLQYGGSGADRATGLAVDAAGNLYMAGNTLSTDNVILNGAQPTRPGLEDAFLVRYDSAGTLAYASYIGGSKSDYATGLAVDASGLAYVIGRTRDAAGGGFATTAGAFATTAPAHETGYLRIYDTRIAGAGSLAYSTFIGGSRDAGGAVSGTVVDSPTGIAVSGGQVAIVGHTDTSDFPTTADATSRTNTAGLSGFVFVLAPQGGGASDIVYGSYYGTGLATGGVAWSGSSVVLAGSTTTTTGITTADGWKPAYGAGGEGVVAMFSGFTNVAPILAGTGTLPAQLEDDAASGGTLVSDLVTGRITDRDAGALAGIAVTAADSSHGRWEFTRDGGATWATLATPAAGSALLLDADTLTRVRFVPQADYAGGSTITFRAWDRTLGSAGSVVAMPATGGGSAFSSAEATASVTVTPVNDAPVRTAGTLDSLTRAEGSAAASLGLGSLAYGAGGGVDEAVQSLTYTVTGLPGAVGSIQLADGTGVVQGGSYTLSELQGMRFLAGRTGTATFSFSVRDSGGVADGGQDVLPQSLTLTVTNTAPVLTGANAFTQLEDLPGTGTLVSDIVAAKVIDGGGPYGIAVTAVPPLSYGSWDYSTDGGANWTVLTGTEGNALLLGLDARVRFVADAEWNGSVAGFTFRAWDLTSGTQGDRADTVLNGGMTAFSSGTGTASLAILPVNDVPLRYNIFTGVLPAPGDVAVNEGSAPTSLGLGYLRYVPGDSNEEYYSQAIVAYTVTGVPTATLGTVYLADGVTAVTANTGYSLAQIQGMRFRPAVGAQGGTGLLTWSVQDNAGTTNGGVDTLNEQVSITVRNVAPVLNGYTPLAPILEDAQSAGVRVSDFVDMSDASLFVGIAVTGTNGQGGGTWQWTRDGGGTWNSLAAASTTEAVLLQGGGQWRLRFLPDANWNSTLTATQPSITFRAWDGSSGTGGGTADTTSNGLATAFSSTTRTASITVTAVNDAPARTDVPGASLTPLVLLDGSPMTSLGLAGVTFGPSGGADEAGQSVSPNYTVTSLPSGLGSTWLADGTTQVTLGGIYTLAQVQGMQFLSSGVGALGTQNFSFTVADNGGVANGGADTATFTATVIVNRAPVLSGANSPLSVLEDFGGTGNAPPGQVPSWATPAQRAGITVADIVAGQIVDTTASELGIAVIGKAGGGTWQYSLDGTNWTTIGSVANNGALLLAGDAQTKVRFIPDADWNSDIGTASLTFRAWDRTTGTAGQLGDATYNGGASAYSAATATTIATVTARNDAPAAVGVPTGGSVEEGAGAVPVLAAGGYAAGPASATDETTQAITVRFTAAIPDALELVLADGVTVVPRGDTTTTYTLAQFLGMQFRSATGATPGAYQLAFELADNGGTLNNGVDRSAQALTLTITNRAPVLLGANAMTGMLEDTPDTGTLVSALVAGQVTDPTGTRGIAVTAVDDSNGSWQYSRDAGGTWTAFGAASAENARLLLADANTRVRFVPAADFSGSATLTFAGWDGTSGAAGGLGNATASGLGTAFSIGTATTTIVVSPVNDPPMGGGTGSLTVLEDSGSTSLGLAGVSYGPGGGAFEAGQSLTYTVAALPAASFGRITLADGTDVALGDCTLDQLRGMRFVAAANAVGTASFGFTVKDDGGGTDTLAQSVAITITPINDAPVAGFDVLAGAEDTPLDLDPAALLANDTDVDLDTLAIASVANGTGGTVALVAGRIVFTPAADFNGIASFSYTVSDGQGGTSITGVVINLAAVNDAPAPVADGVSGSEDQAVTIVPATLLGNDGDVDGDLLAITAVGGATNGSVALSGGNIVFTPNLDFNGAASFTYTVSDPSGATGTATVTVNVGAVNDAPVAVADSVNATEDTPATILPATLLGNDTDADGHALTVTGVANGSGGTVALVGGDIVFTPSLDFTGAATFSYTASDGNGGSASVTVTVNVAPVNDAPAAGDDSATATADTPLTLTPATLLGNDTDVEGNALTITAVGGAVNGSVALVAGNVVFTPTPAYVGPASFTYTVSDGTGSDTATVSVEVIAGNTAPVAVADTLAATEDTPATVLAATLAANDTDVDLDTLAVTGVTAVAGGTVSLLGGTITFTPTANFNGEGRFTYTVSDGNGGVATGTVTVNVAAVNDAPVANPDSFAGTEDQALTLAQAALLGNDTDVDGPALAVSAVGGAVGGTVQILGGNIVFTPTADFNGVASFTYTAFDGTAGTVGNVTVNLAPVNDAPVAAVDTATTPEEQALTIAAADLLLNDTDVDGGILTVVGVANGTGGTVVLSGTDIVFTPATDFNGAGSFSYTVRDAAGATSTAVVTVAVTPLNDAPVANDDAVSGTEDQVLTLALSSLTTNDSDVDGDALTVQSVADGTGGTVAISGGNFVFTPTANFNGPATFSYTVSDGAGGSDTATVTVNLAPVNDAPVGVADSVLALEDQQLAIPAATLLANDTDVEGQALAITSVASGTGGTVALVGSDVVFTPTPNFNGGGSFSYVVSDGAGGTATVNVAVTVAAVNDVPVVAGETLGTPEDVPLTIAPATLLVNDTDVEGHALSITAVANGTGGTVALVGGNIVFTPTLNFSGTATFDYTVEDSLGATSIATATVTVTAVNDPPLALVDAVTAAEDQLLVLAAEDLLANDSDAEADPMTIVAVGGAVNGTVSISGASIVFAPTADYQGPARFTYTVSDGRGGSTTQVVDVNVTPVNDPPVAHADLVAATEDTPATIAAATLIANDTDIENDVLTVTGVASGVGGTVALAGGSIVFTPTANFNGPGSFTYTVSDGNGGTATATVTVEVAEVNDAPVAVDDGTLATAEDTPLTVLPGTLLANDSDVDGDSSTITGVTGGVGGVAELSGGNVIFTPDPDFNGAASFGYTVSDGRGGTHGARVDLVVTPEPDAPRPVADAAETVEDTPLTLDPATLLANDREVDGEAMMLTAVASGTGGTVVLSGGSIVFTPAADFNGVGRFTYTVSDGTSTANGTVDVTVRAVDDAPVAQDASVAASEDVPFSGAVTAADPDSAPLTYALVTGPANGVLAFNADGSYTYQANANWSGADSFTFKANDGALDSNVATVTVSVAAVNDAPVAQAGAAGTGEDTPLAGNVAATDIDSASLAYAVVSGPTHGTLNFNADGSYTYQGDANWSGADSFTFKANDGTADSNVATVSLTVTPVNDAPVAQDAAASTNEDTPVSDSVGATDVDSAGLTYVLVAGPTRGTLNFNADGSYTYQGDANWSGADSFTFKANDGASDSNVATVSLTVTAVNDAPVAQDAAASTNEDTPVGGSVGATDVDSAGLTYVLVAGPTRGMLNFNADGSYTYQGDANWSGADSFTFKANDGTADSNVATVSLTVTAVNDAPVAQDAAASTNEDTPVGGSVGATDVDSAGLTYVLVAGPTRGMLNFNADGSYTYRGDANWSGADSFTFKANDGTADSNVATVSLTVTAVNDAPVAQNGSAGTNEDTPVSGSVAATDVDSAGLKYALLAGPAHGTLTFSADGSYTYQGAANWSGADSFTFKASDGALDSNVATVRISVAAANDAPVAQDGSAATNEDTPVSGNVTATDVDGARPGYILVAGPTHGSLSFGGDGSYTYRPDANWSGADSFSFKASDGALDSNVATVSISVVAVNDAPERSGELQELAVVEGAPAMSLGLENVVYTAGGGSDEAAQALGLTVTALPDAALGQLVLGDGRTALVEGGRYTLADLQGLRFIAAAGAGAGRATFEFLVSDDGGTRDGGSDTLARQAVTIRLVNQAPTLAGANALPALREDAADNRGMAVADLIAGRAADPGGRLGIAVTAAESAFGQWQYSRDGLRWSAFEGVGADAAELLTGAARIRFVPAADWNGTATGLAFRAWDGSGGTAAATRADTRINGGDAPFSTTTATATVVVEAVNDAPRGLGVVPPSLTADGSTGSSGLAALDWNYVAGGGGDEATQVLTIVVTEVPAPELGTLLLADGATPVVAGASYTPEQLRGMRFVAARGSEGQSATLAWVVRDDGGTERGGSDQVAGSLRITVAAQAVADPAPAPAPAAPAPASAPVASAPASAPVPPTATPAAPPAAPAAARPAGDALVESPATPLAEPPLQAVVLQRLPEPQHATRTLGAAPRVGELQLVAFQPQGADFELTGMGDFNVSGVRFTLEQFQQSLRSGIFVNELNQLREQLRQEFDLDRTMTVSVAGLSLGVSVAYVLWLVRGGVLVGSYLSALPAWRLLDPLPVLSRAGEAEGHEDEEDAFEPDAGQGPDPLRGFS